MRCRTERIDAPRTVPGLPLSSLASAALSPLRDWMRGRRTRRDYEALLAGDDRLMEDIGLSRRDLAVHLRRSNLDLGRSTRCARALMARSCC